jgi:hypothetical protein
MTNMGQSENRERYSELRGQLGTFENTIKDKNSNFLSNELGYDGMNRIRALLEEVKETMKVAYESYESKIPGREVFNYEYFGRVTK